jgi:hypothetical protein
LHSKEHIELQAIVGWPLSDLSGSRGGLVAALWLVLSRSSRVGPLLGKGRGVKWGEVSGPRLRPRPLPAHFPPARSRAISLPRAFRPSAPDTLCRCLVEEGAEKRWRVASASPPARSTAIRPAPHSYHACSARPRSRRCPPRSRFATGRPRAVAYLCSTLFARRDQSTRGAVNSVWPAVALTVGALLVLG